jgi:hypothetical protein
LEKKVLGLSKNSTAKQTTLAHSAKQTSSRHSVSVAGSSIASISQRILERGAVLQKNPAQAKVFLNQTGMYETDGKLKKEFR